MIPKIAYSMSRKAFDKRLYTVIASSSIRQSYFNNYGTLSTVSVSDVVKKLNNYAPLSLAEPWDNVGLLIEPPGLKNVSNILLTIDLTYEVLKEAKKKNASFLLAYHPVLFQPFKRLVHSDDNWKCNIARHCVHQEIAVYSPHTCYDVKSGGVNDWLINTFGDGDLVTAIVPKSTKSSQIEIHLLPNVLDITLKKFQEALKALPFSSDLWTWSLKDKIVIQCKPQSVFDILSAIKEILMIDENLISLKNMDSSDLKSGLGRQCILRNPLTICQAISKVKQYLQLTHLRVAIGNGKSMNSEIRKVAVCAGAGFSVLKNVSPGVQLVLTGEMSHHQILDFTQKGISVLLTEHSNSERGFLSQVILPFIVEAFEGNVSVEMSQMDADPLTTM